jgi:5-amino-6-(5-phospho-D-ribitylamino)uracil phosphatase
MKYNLVAFDLDGTLLDSHKHIRRDTLAAITEIQTSGVFITFVTGRSFASTVPYAQQLGLQTPFGIYHGALVRDLLGLEVLKRAIPRGGIREVIRLSVDHGCVPMMLGIQSEGNLTFCKEDENHPAVRYVVEVEKTENPSPEIHFVPRDEVQLDAYAVYIMGPPSGITGFLEGYESRGVRLFNAERFPVNTGAANSEMQKTYEVGMLTPIGADKRVALEAIADSLGIPMTEVLAFGDWHNDVPMLAAAGGAVLMGNAPAAVAAKINHPNLYRTGSNDTDGVVQALERFGLL